MDGQKWTGKRAEGDRHRRSVAIGPRSVAIGPENEAGKGTALPNQPPPDLNGRGPPRLGFTARAGGQGSRKLPASARF